MDIAEATQLLVAGNWIKVTSVRVAGDQIVASDRSKMPGASYCFKEEAVQGYRCTLDPTPLGPQVPVYQAWTD